MTQTSRLSHYILHVLSLCLSLSLSGSLSLFLSGLLRQNLNGGGQRALGSWSACLSLPPKFWKGRSWPPHQDSRVYSRSFHCVFMDVLHNSSNLLAPVLRLESALGCLHRGNEYERQQIETSHPAGRTVCWRETVGQQGPGRGRFLHRQLSSVGRVQSPVPASPSLSTRTRSVFPKSFLNGCNSKQKRQEMTSEEFLKSI